MKVIDLYQRSSLEDQQGPLFCCICVPGVLPHLLHKAVSL